MILLVIMGLLLGQMLYRWRIGLVPATFATVGIILGGVGRYHTSMADAFCHHRVRR